MYRSYDKPIPLHLTQRLGQHLLADVSDPFANTGETGIAMLGQDLQDQHGPFVCDPADHLIDEGLDARIGVLAGFRMRNSGGRRCRHCSTFYWVSMATFGAYFPMESVSHT